MRTWAILALLLCPVAFSQDADVVSLSPEEAVQSKLLYRNLRNALKEWEDWNKALKEKHIIVPCILNQTVRNPESDGLLDGPAGKNRCLRSGFPQGFRYTRDFRALLPSPKPFPTDVFDCWKVRP